MGRKSSWNSLRRLALLAASILSSCFLLTEGQSASIQVLLKPQYPAEGQDIELTLTTTPGDAVEKALSCSWYRGLITDRNKLIYTYYIGTNVGRPGVASTGRETVESGCSLRIRNVTSGDSGNYTVNLSGPDIDALGQASMIVSENLTRPVLNSSAYNMVEENTNVTLNCSTSNTTGVRVTWFKDDKSLSAGADLSDGDRILTLTRVTKSNTGLYRCTASNFVSSAESNLVNITVAYGPVIQLNPEGTVEKSLNSDLKLECTADSVPGALFQWFFNNTKQEATGNSFQVQLSNWANEGNYTCQATNPFTHRNATKTVYVKLIEGSPDPGLSPGAIAGIVIGCLAGVGLVAGLLYFICTKTSLGRTERQASNGNVPSAPGHNEGVTDTKPKAAEEDLQYSILAFKDSNRSPPRPGSEAPPPSDGVTIYSEIKKK